MQSALADKSLSRKTDSSQPIIVAAMALLAQCKLQGELMDQPGLDESLHRQALAGLQRVNFLSRTAHVVWRHGVSPLLADGGASLRVLDLACGGGDVALQLAKTALAAGVELTIHGWDKSLTAVEKARHDAQQAGLQSVEFFQRDVLEDLIADPYDLVYSTLFLHHLSHSQAVRLLQRMSASATGLVLIDDLRRTRFGYGLAWVGGRILSRSPVVHVDGPLSVSAAFTTREMLALAGEAGLTGARVTQHWPQRFLFRWPKR